MKKKSLFISIVDDDESVRRALKRLFKSAGYNVETFATAADYLKFPRKDEACCLVLDVRMPGMTGIELQEHLKRTGDLIPVIFISAHDDEKIRSRVLQSGAEDFLLKPFDDQILLDRVLSLVGSLKDDDK